MHLPVLPERAARRAPRLLVLLVPALLLVATLAPIGAAADPIGSHDPIGAVEGVRTITGGIQVSGWAADPDDLADNVTAYGLVDGHIVTRSVTNVARLYISHLHDTGPTPGFNFAIPVPSGNHGVCIAVQNVGSGLSTVLRCIATPLGRIVTSTSAHNPQGVVSAVSATTNSLTVSGWATDPDFRGRPLVAVLYVDGVSAKTVYTGVASSDQVAAGSGPFGAYRITVPVASGSHLACVWVVNVGFGSDAPFACNTVDTRGSAGSGPVTTPAANTAALTEAKKHIGQRYVWGAAGPSTFDCSGLVTYSYGKAGIASVPHQSGMQFNLAHVIPAWRAVPGDLVFYHDQVGSVYHVGIYISPGNTVAAIDESQGVNYQRVWDPTMVTYGSLTHT
jgi:cell wall-associated NlpC family hydrolase